MAIFSTAMFCSKCVQVSIGMLLLLASLCAEGQDDPAGQNQNNANTSNQQSTSQQAPSDVNLVIGLGFAGPSDSPDYTVSSNTISSTHEGKATPQYMLGLAYPIGINYYPRTKKGQQAVQHCLTDTDANTAATAADFRCKPIGAFVSAKFSTDSSSTVNGVTFGITHRIAGTLSLLIAGSLSPFQQPSQGFINAAVQTVVTQKAAGNPFYSQFNPTAMQANLKDAFDGFPTVLMTNTGTASAPTYTAGAQIYTGNVLVNNYKPGFLIGVAITPNAIKLLTNSK